MDKYEYNLKTEQIKKMYEKKDFKTVTEIADNFDFRKIKDNSLINIIAEAYEERDMYEEAIEVLMAAYERSPLGRQLAYRLALLSVKANQISEAIEFYNDFIKMAPKDIGQYILKYEIAKISGATSDELIDILETYVFTELDEKWQYELAKLYHESGYSIKCVEQCDEIILWFSEGKYVVQAMELKMLYAPLTESQQVKYNNREADLKLLTNIQEELEGSIENELKNEIDSELNIAEEEIIEEEIIEEVAITQIKDDYENSIYQDIMFEEEFDGQIGLFIDPPKEIEEQIEGQLTIGELLDAYDERQNLIKDQIRLNEQELEKIKQEQEEIDSEIEEEMVLPIEEEDLELLCDEYKDMFIKYLHIDGVEEQLAKALYNLINQYDKDGTSKKNNLIIIGDSKSGRTSLIIDFIKIVNRKRERRGRKIAKVKGTVLNHKGLEQTFPKLLGTDLIIEQAANMNPTTIKELVTYMNSYTEEMIVVLEDNKSAIERLLSVNTELIDMFNNVINIHGLGVKEWVDIAKDYALSKEYTIDEMGILALHVKVSNLFSKSAELNMEEVQAIIDNAIEKKRTSKLVFSSILSSNKRKSEASILKESDFI